VVADQQVAIVTGASSGFGRLITYALAADGYRVVGAFRGSHGGFDSQAEHLVDGFTAGGPEHLAGSVEPLRMDVSDAASVSRGIQDIHHRTGRIDVLVNAAGYGLLGPMECTPIAETTRLYQTNVFGTMMLCQAIAPLMRARGGGTIVNMGSDVGVRPNLFQSSYAATKFAVDGFSQVLRLELAPFGIKVALVVPGWYATEFGNSVVSTFTTSPYAEIYAELAAAWEIGVAAVEGPNPDPHEVMESVMAAVRSKAQHYRYIVGWNSDRIGDIDEAEVEHYQNRLRAYYRLDDLRFAPAAAETGARR